VLGSIIGVGVFANATTNLTGASWAGGAVALVVVISGFGALNGWTMLSAEMPKAADQDGLFPARFDRLSRRVPIFGILISGVLASVLVLVSYIGEAGITVFNTLILMNGIAAAIPYTF
jgi:APA family basic amino acid/polyamine antiporter